MSFTVKAFGGCQNPRRCEPCCQNCPGLFKQAKVLITPHNANGFQSATPNEAVGPFVNGPRQEVSIKVWEDKCLQCARLNRGGK